ncbi:MAG: PIN domain-containing protein [Gammaproteobacteria bacterium]
MPTTTPCTAVIDACVLCSPLKRNIVASFAEAGLFHIRWSDEIMDETEKAISIVAAKHSHKNIAVYAGSIRSLLNQAFKEATVSGYDSLGKTIGKVPDEGDRHVMAAALKAKAEFIVTENLRDFPRRVLKKYGIEAKSSDTFIADTIDSNPSVAIAALNQLLTRLNKSEHTLETLMIRMKHCGLKQSAEQVKIATALKQ